MSNYSRLRIPEEHRILKTQEVEAKSPTAAQPLLPPSVKRATGRIASLSPSNVLQLQRMVGNQTVVQMVQDEQSLQRAVLDEDDLLCPGSKIRSGGLGRGEGVGQGKGPIGRPFDEERS